MSAAEEELPVSRAAHPLVFGTIVVVGGGCYGAYYVRQLERAWRAGAVRWERVLVVDRDTACKVRTAATDEQRRMHIEVVVSDWSEFFAGYLVSAAEDRTRSHDDAIVPSPLMPHLMFNWLLDRARQRWPDRTVEARALERAPNIPWQRASAGGTHFVSFAEWMCPINCIEPPLCPHIRGPRTWSLPRAARAYVAEERRRGRPLVGPVIFHCAHRAYGVGMFDTRDVLAADTFVLEAGSRGPAELLVGTMSHCHGAFDRLVIGPSGRAPGFVGARH
jgi:hypothetical protein